MHNMIPLSVQINGNEWVYIKECLETGWSLHNGTNEFERKTSEYVGARHASVNGTSAFKFPNACRRQAGDELLCPP